MIDFQQVCYYYPQATAPALDRCTLQIAEGEFVLVCGASGSGKSSLLRAINGLIPHFHGGTWQGQLKVCGRDTRRNSPRDLAELVGFVFQDPDAQFVVEIVEDELAFAMENAGLPQAIMRRRIEEALDQLEIAHLRHRSLSSLSGGERQRVAIAAALTVQPQILVLDEPTSQLDPHTAEEVLTALQKLNADLGLTIVLSEHRLERVVQYVDRMVWMHAGKIGLAAAPQVVLAQMPFAPPLVEVARHFNWQPLPLTIKQGRAAARQQPITPQAHPTPVASLGAELLRSEALDASYADQPALQGVNVRLHAGEIVAIMGRNGSGKTTLLRHLVGLQQPIRGRVLLQQQPIANRPVEQLAQQIGFVPQNPSDILFHPSLEQELAWTLTNHGQEADPIQIEQTLQRLNLLHLRERHPRDLSGGEAQRAAFAAIVVARPQILLLDEPTRGLDYAAKQQLANFLQSLASEQHGIIVVTHDVEFVALCAQRVVLLGEGEVVVEGTPQVVLGDSLLFSTQVGKLFPKFGWLSVADVLAGTSQ